MISIFFDFLNVLEQFESHRGYLLYITAIGTAFASLTRNYHNCQVVNWDFFLRVDAFPSI